MRASIILAALAATPFAAARACRHVKPSGVKQLHHPSPTTVYESETEIPSVETPSFETPTEEEDSSPVYETPTEDETETPEPTVEPETPVDTGSSGGFTPLGGGSSGIATFYSGDLSGGTCSFTTYSLPEGLTGVALATAEWDDAAHCGACVKVTGPKGNSIIAMVVDQCPTCDAGHIDLFPDAFEALDDPVVGIIDVSWEFVACDITSPAKLHNKDGTSQYWFSMQVVNSNHPVDKLEVSTDGGSNWESTERTYYNFFERSGGFGTSSVDVRITSSDGSSIITKDVSVSSDSETTCGSNF